MYLETSRDILNLVLSFGVLWLVILLSWLLWHVIGITRAVHATLEDFRNRLRAVDEVLQLIREKLESTSTYLGLLVDVVKEGIRWMRDRGDTETPFVRKSIKKR